MASRAGAEQSPLHVGRLVGAGFALIRARPAAVLVWTLLYFAAVVAMAFALRPGAQAQAAMMGNRDPQVMMANMQLLGRQMLIQLAFWIFVCVLFTAVLRAMLRPAEGGLAFLRLGGDELRIVGLSVFLIVCIYLGFIVAAVILALVAALAGAVGGLTAAAAVGVIEVLALICVFVWLEVRISLALPLTFLRRSFVLAESWRLTRGRFWTLLGGYALIFLILLVLGIAAAAIVLRPYLNDLLQGGFTSENIRSAVRNQMMRQLSNDPMAMLGSALNALVGALTLILFGGATASAARALAEDIPGTAATFA